MLWKLQLHNPRFARDAGHVFIQSRANLRVHRKRRTHRCTKFRQQQRNLHVSPARTSSHPSSFCVSLTQPACLNSTSDCDRTVPCSRSRMHACMAAGAEAPCGSYRSPHCQIRMKLTCSVILGMLLTPPPHGLLHAVKDGQQTLEVSQQSFLRGPSQGQSVCTAVST